MTKPPEKLWPAAGTPERHEEVPQADEGGGVVREDADDDVAGEDGDGGLLPGHRLCTTVQGHRG